MLNEVPPPPEYDRGNLDASWWRRNWILGFAIASLGLALLKARNWYVFRHADEAIDAVVNTAFAIVLGFVHRERKNAQRYLDAKRRTEGEANPYEVEVHEK